MQEPVRFFSCCGAGFIRGGEHRKRHALGTNYVNQRNQLAAAALRAALAVTFNFFRNRLAVRGGKPVALEKRRRMGNGENARSLAAAGRAYGRFKQTSTQAASALV